MSVLASPPLKKGSSYEHPYTDVCRIKQLGSHLIYLINPFNEKILLVEKAKSQFISIHSQRIHPHDVLPGEKCVCGREYSMHQALLKQTWLYEVQNSYNLSYLSPFCRKMSGHSDASNEDEGSSSKSSSKKDPDQTKIFQTGNTV